MANEIQVSSTLSYAKTPVPLQSLVVSNVNANVAGTNYTKISQTIPTSAGGTALSLGGVSTPGWCMLVNRDSANYVDVLTAVSGTPFARMLPNEPFLLRFNPGITAPALQANTASVLVEGMVVAV